MQWQVLTFNELDTYTLYGLLQLRVDVFVVEQNCPYPELDDKDLHPETRHILLKKAGKILAYARVLAPDVSFAGNPGIGRVCVAQTARRLGLGEVLVQKAIARVPHGGGRKIQEGSLPHKRLTRWIAEGLRDGVGAFVPRRMVLDGLSAFEGTQVFAEHPAPERWASQHLVVAGEGDAALQTCLSAIEGPQAAASVTLLHRREQFSAAPDLIAQMRQACAEGRMRFVAGQPTGLKVEQGRLQALELLNPQGETEWLSLDVLQTCLGLSPKLGPVAQWGLAMERKQLVVNTENFGTSEPGIFAVGDINTYPGKKKLILCGFHEATLAAFAAAAIVHPERRVLLQYTTTSPRLHELLGVAGTSART